MSHSSQSPWRRPLPAVLLGAVDLVSWSALAGLRAVPAGPEIADLLVVLSAWVVTLGLGWLTLLAVLVAIEPLTGRDLASAAGCPPVVRRALLALCGAAVVGALATPAQAAPAALSVPHQSATDHRGHGVDGLPLPDRATGSSAGPTPGATPPPGWSPTSTTSPTSGPTSGPMARRTTTHRSTGKTSPSRPHAAGASVVEVVVAPGQCLWSIAHDRLVADNGLTSAASVEAAWRAIYAANRDVVGTDPDVLRPGTRLTVPTPIPHAKETDR